MQINGPVWVQIIRETARWIILRHLMVRPREAVNDNKPVRAA